MPDPRESVNNARAALKAASSELVDRLFEFEVAREGLREAKRKGGTAEADAQAALDAADTAFRQARGNEAALRTNLQVALGVWLPPTMTIEEDFARLESMTPIVLFPIRVETRFDGDFLKVRISPDEIFLNTHEKALTLEEQERAKDYYIRLVEQTGSTTDPSGLVERPLWRDMVSRFGVERSAYVLRVMRPTFGQPGDGSYSYSSAFPPSSGDPDDLVFPPVQSRESTWTRPGEAVLPDRWAVYTYNGDTRNGPILGKQIVEPLALTPDPKMVPEELVPFNGTYMIDDRLRWTMDFQRAVDVGMGISIQLTEAEKTSGFDRIVVVGVKSSMSALDTSKMLEELFDAHHYTSGLAIVRQGSPTNNTEGKPTEYPLRENAGELTFATERQPPPQDNTIAFDSLSTLDDGYTLRTMLGIPSGVFSNVARSRGREILNAQLMNEVLWPGTFGYFMRDMLEGKFTAAEILDAKNYFRQHVLARGVAPAIRIGSIPYGVLPVASLASWAERDFGTPAPFDNGASKVVEAALLSPMRHLYELWKEGAALVPRFADAHTNPDIPFARAVALHPSPRQFRIRRGFGFPVQSLIYQIFGWDAQDLLEEYDVQSGSTFGLAGFSEWEVPLGRMLFERTAQLFTGQVVAPTLSEDPNQPLTPNFISGIANAPIQDLNFKTGMAVPPATENLLYLMLRHSTLTEYMIGYEREVQPTTPLPHIEIFGLVFGEQHPPTIPPSIYSFSPDQLAFTHQRSLNFISQLATAEIERLFTETLSLAAYRLDAWITALAARRLAYIRVAQVNAELAPKGDFLGGYGWVENVRPRTPPTTEDIPGVGIVEHQTGNGGFIHAPSMTQASAAAVLRSGHLNVRGDAAAASAVDLSSRRVRVGRRLFEGVRNGQPVGALLGYDIERRLHDLGLDVIRFALRRLFPLVANKSGQDGTEPTETIAARNVVDGSLLLRAYDQNEIPFGSNDLPAQGTAEFILLRDELDQLKESYDAAADLLTAEGVFQLVRGNIDAAATTMTNVVEGAQPPETVISRSSRHGIGIDHHVALVFQTDPIPELSPEWDAIPLTPRSNAERVLNVWLSDLIGDPGEVKAELTYRDADGNVITSTHDENGTPVMLQSVEVTLAELQIHPLDVLALAEAISQNNQGSTLDRRIVAAALAHPDKQPDEPPARFEVNYDVENARTFPEVIEVLHVTSGVLGASRPLALEDLLSPAEIDEVKDEADTTPDPNALDFYTRATLAVEQLRSVKEELDTADVTGYRSALTRASHFEPLSAFPDPAVADDALAPAVEAALRELERRDRIVPAPIEEPEDAPRSELIRAGTKILKIVFGANFLALPFVAPPRPEEIGRSLAARTTLLAGDDEAPDRYLYQVMRARPRLGRFRKLNLYARTFGLPRLRVDTVQLPHVPGERWLGLPFDDPDTPPEEGRVAMLLLSYADELDPEVAWAGVHLDNWDEIIPLRKEDTGIAFNYAAPGAKAPQTILVVAPSSTSATWVPNELVASVEQALNLAKIRAVDLEMLGFAQLVPATIFETNENPANAISSAIQGVVEVIDSTGLT